MPVVQLNDFRANRLPIDAICYLSAANEAFADKARALFEGNARFAANHEYREEYSRKRFAEACERMRARQHREGGKA